MGNKSASVVFSVTEGSSLSLSLLFRCTGSEWNLVTGDRELKKALQLLETSGAVALAALSLRFSRALPMVMDESLTSYIDTCIRRWLAGSHEVT